MPLLRQSMSPEVSPEGPELERGRRRWAPPPLTQRIGPALRKGNGGGVPVAADREHARGGVHRVSKSRTNHKERRVGALEKHGTLAVAGGYLFGGGQGSGDYSLRLYAGHRGSGGARAAPR